MSEIAKATIHFMDGTKLAIEYPRQAGEDAATISMNVRKVLEADKITLEAQGDLIVIPVRNIKYIQISPAPDEIPAGVLRNVKIVG